ncbi:LVIVD repeat-containing protein [Winogradskyella sp.]|uniref:LVIVD repeat-containing protein n=1 Tax=Winogradskyella sp. TaxID=1883156 RepID=UPI003514679D
MKNKILPLVLVVLLGLQLTNCNSDDDGIGLTDPVAVTVPVIMSKTEMRNSISVQSAQSTNSDGKIYVYNDLLFYIAQNSGIHIFDNQNPASPQNLVFIQLEGVNDISVKDNILYADNFMDLVVFDISNISNIQLLNIEEDMLTFYAAFPDDSLYFQYNQSLEEDEFISAYETVYMERDDVENDPDIFSYTTDVFVDIALSSENGGYNIGTGGSYAKFQIFNNALYTIDDFRLFTFDITDYNNISLSAETWMGGWFGGAELETTYILKNNLFIGATNGMHIVSLQNEFSPTYMSSFLHATGCDPVVVEGNTAYITVRGGNGCGAIEDQVNIIDVTDLSSPVEYSTYFLSSPYGLGVKDQVLYVCNDNGINVFDAQNPNGITLENTYSVNAKDVIALSTHLIAVGENVIHQYNYTDNFGLELIDSIQF